MSSNNIQNNKKIIQFKDIISILLVILIISLSICGVLADSYTAPHNNVTARNLAMFASLAYADLENIETFKNKLDLKNKTSLNLLTEIKSDNLTFNEVDMVTDEQLKGIDSNTELLGISLSDEEEKTYDYLFYGLASTNEVKDWKIVNYTKFDTTVAKGTAQFAAMTFRKDNDIIIAYRGTDFDDIGDWLQDICYGAVGYAGQENVAQDYARIIADHYAGNNNNVHIYITGHSLGGYLAQIGGAELAADEKYANNLKKIVYFNGMGLKFDSNITSNFNKNIKNTFDELSKYSGKTYNVVDLNNSKIKNILNDTNTIQNNAMKSLKSFYNNDDEDPNIILYKINGDLVSSLGTHIGAVKGYDAYDKCVQHHKNYPYKSIITVITPMLNKIVPKLISFIGNNDISSYMNKYETNFLSYIWITHETDSFFGVLPEEKTENEEEIPTIEVRFENVPSTIKRNFSKTIDLIVTVKNGKLKTTNLKTSDFIITNKFNKKTDVHLKISSVALIEKDESENNDEKNTKPSTYKFRITIKGGKVVGNSKITLKKGVFKSMSKSGNKMGYNVAISTPNYINTKLK